MHVRLSSLLRNNTKKWAPWVNIERRNVARQLLQVLRRTLAMPVTRGYSADSSSQALGRGRHNDASRKTLASKWCGGHDFVIEVVRIPGTIAPQTQGCPREPCQLRDYGTLMEHPCS